MKQIIFSLLFMLMLSDVGGQPRSLVDTGMLGSLPQLSSFEGNIALSSDGHYVAYIVHGQPRGLRTLVLQDLRSTWKKTMVGRSPRILFFSADGRQLCWQQGDSVWLWAGGSDQDRLLCVCNVVSYPVEAKGGMGGASIGEAGQWVEIGELGEWPRTNLLYRYKVIGGWPAGRKLVLTGSGGNVQLLDLANGKERFWAGVIDFALPADAQSILLVKPKENNVTNVQWDDLGGGEPVTIWSGRAGESQGAMYTIRWANSLPLMLCPLSGAVAIWYYRAGETGAVLKADTKSAGLAADLGGEWSAGF